MPRHPCRAAVAAIVIAFTTAATPAIVHAAATPVGTSAGTGTAPAKPPRVARVKVMPGGSTETEAERDRRLRRECRGRPNAGACLGYAR